MTKKLLAILFLVPVLSVGLFIYHSEKTSAAFNANDLIDDIIFDNSSTMNAVQINSWLNTNFPNSCISTNNGFSAPDPTGYSPNPSQFFYSSTPVSTGQIIYDAAQAYGLNPQVLLTTLEKEESLVSGGTGCSSWQYTSATGYGCADSGTNTHNYSYPGGGLVTPLYYINGSPVDSITNSCVNTGPKAGFSEQIIHAAWLLAFGRHKSEGDTGWAVIKGNWDNCDDNNTCPAAWGIPASDACYGGPMTEGNFKLCPTDTSTTFFDGYATIDSSSVHMNTGATAALYWYTPHISGNQSFYNIFTSWFGDTIYHGIPYPHPDGTLVRDQNQPQVYLIENGQRLPVLSQESLFSYGYNFGDVKFANYYDDQLPLGTALPLLKEGTIFQGSGPAIYVYRIVGGTPEKQHFPTWETFAGLGYTLSDVMTVPDWEVPSANYATDVSLTQHPVGTLVQAAGSTQVYYLDPNGTKRSFPDQEVFYSYRYRFIQLKRATTADMQLPTGNPMAFREGQLLQGSGPQIYVPTIQASDGSQQKSLITSWFCFVQLGYIYPQDVMAVPDWELNAMPQEGPAC